MLNMIKMELFRMFKMKSLYVIWMIMAAGIIFTSNLTITEFETMTVEEKQEMYEYAVGTRESQNFGMDVTTPTKPGEQISVLDLIYANMKGKFIAIFMVIFAVIFSTADISSGYVKNIAGQVRDRGKLIYAKAAVLLLYSVCTVLLYVMIQTVSNGIFAGGIVPGDGREFLSYVGLQILLHYAFMMIAMCIAVVMRNNVFTMAIVVCMCMNIMVMFYSWIDKVVAKLGVKDFQTIRYTVSGKMSMLPMEIGAKEAGSAVLTAVVFIVIAVMASSIVFKKRDI